MNLRKDQYHSQHKNTHRVKKNMRVPSGTHTNFFRPTPPMVFEQTNTNQNPPFNDGSLGSSNDEERRETRYVMWIAGLSESSNLWTQMAALALAVGAFLVQTRLPNAKCFIESDPGRCGNFPHRFKNLVASAPLASKRCAEVVKHQGALCFWRARLIQPML